MLFSTALAADPAAAPATSSAVGGADMAGITSMLQLVLPLLAVFYFMMIRPQQKRIKEHQAMLAGLRRGDKVVTGGGVIGVIAKLEADDVVVLEIAPDVKIRVVRETISNVITKTVANDNKPEDKAAKE